MPRKPSGPILTPGGDFEQRHTPPPPIRNLRPDVPQALENLLLEMLAKESEQRLTASEVYEALLAVQAEHAAIAVPARKPLADQEADAASDLAARLAKEGQFVQARRCAR